MNNRKALQDEIARNNESIASLTRGMLAAIQVLTDNTAKASAALKTMDDTAEAVSHTSMRTNLESGIPSVDQYWNEEIGLEKVNPLLTPHNKLKKKLDEPLGNGEVHTCTIGQ